MRRAEKKWQRHTEKKNQSAGKTEWEVYLWFSKCICDCKSWGNANLYLCLFSAKRQICHYIYHASALLLLTNCHIRIQKHTAVLSFCFELKYTQQHKIWSRKRNLSYFVMFVLSFFISISLCACEFGWAGYVEMCFVLMCDSTFLFAIRKKMIFFSHALLCVNCKLQRSLKNEKETNQIRDELKDETGTQKKWNEKKSVERPNERC